MPTRHVACAALLLPPWQEAAAAAEAARVAAEYEESERLDQIEMDRQFASSGASHHSRHPVALHPHASLTCNTDGGFLLS